MKISDAKILLTKLVDYNINQYERGAGKGISAHNTYLIPYFVGDPGVGKTAIPFQVAMELADRFRDAGLDFGYFQTIVAQYDAGEMAGLPFSGTKEYDTVDDDGKVTGKKQVQRMMRLRPSYLPDSDDPRQQFGIYNLDEIAQSFLANMNICSQLVNEYRIGEHPLSQGITMCATGNKPENKAGTTSMPMHLRDRLMFIEIEADIEDWLVYAAQKGIDPRVRTYLRQRPDRLHKFKVGMNAFPSPRSWEKTGAIMSMDWDDQSERHIRIGALKGQIGEGEVTEFEAWLRVEDKLPKWQDVIADPMKAPVFDNTQADVMFLLLATLADQANEKNIPAILQYVQRIPNQEFVMMWAKDTFLAHKELLNNKAVTAWKVKEGTKYMF